MSTFIINMLFSCPTKITMLNLFLSLLRYRHEFKSQELWEEIKFVLENFASELTELFKVKSNLSTYFLFYFQNQDETAY